MILISFISFLCGFTTSSNRFAKKRNRNGIILELRISPKEGKTTKEILNKKEQREMKKQIEIQIENEFRKIERSQMKKYPLLRGCIRDGILYPEQYEKSPFKMLVLLKEPYDEWDDNTETPIGGDFGFVDVIYNLETHCQEGLNKTWRKIAAIAYALKEGTKYTEDLSYEQIKEGLECVCFINLSKTPWRTTSDLKDPSYQQRVKDWESVVKAQLLHIDFDVVLYGGTWLSSSLNPINPNEVWDYAKIQNIQLYKRKTPGNKNLTIQILRYDNSKQIIVNGYHPAFGNCACWQTECIRNYYEKTKEFI